MDLSSTSTVPEPRSSNLNPDPSLDRNMTPSSPSHCQDDQASSTSAFSDYFKTTPTFTASATPSTTATSYSTTAYVDDDVTTANHPSRDSCDRRRPNDGDASKFPANMPTQLVGQTVTPFLREHIPGIYAPIGKPDIQNENSNNYNNSNGTNNSGHLSQTRDANSKFCYRHRPDAKCRRAADESKMVLIQSELDKLPSADQQAITHVWSLFSAAPAKHRDLMLQGIITQCCFPQLSTVSREVHEQLKIDFMAALPTEISYKVLGYLDTVSLCKAAQVSRRWRDLADDDVVWHRMCEQHIDRKCTKCGFGLPLLERKRLRDWNKQKELAEARSLQQAAPVEAVEQVDEVVTASSPNANKKRELVVLDDGRKRACLSDVGEPMAPKTGAEKERERLIRPWKSVYRDRFKVGFNWKYGRCHIKTFKGHDNGVTCLQFDDEILATGSYDAKIKIWNIVTGEEIRTLSGHTMGIRTLKFVGNKLFSGSLDHTVKVWNWQTGDCISTLRCHTEGVITVDFDGKFLASGSIDKSIKIFNFDSKETFCLRGHEDWVNHVRLDPGSQTLFSASDDCTVRLWDLRNKTCIKTFEGHMGQVQQILLMPEDFEPDEEALAGDDNASVNSGRSTTPTASANVASILGSSFGGSDSVTAEDDRTSFGCSFSSDPTRQLPPRYMLTAGLDNTVKVWNIHTGKCLRTMFGHVEGIWGLVGDTLRIVTGANDSMVKVWEPKSGKCERTFTGHSGPVTCVGLSDSRMASGSEDGEVRLYSFEADGPLLEECGTPA
ncbi:WD domain-containing protein [Colletotrichum higginsianum IMI 349063]|uniref:WD domain-containing protein n=4 Tax=Colletotrichum higginsianum TaxID=80884 RepID=A0A1B7YRW8_COLHI|nr:WD domain-containing protein [Colletotrichum higginsianum IMI 349063]OBR14776.1 WD domain-containing protein [Colletotrichum higginsianum IMI 349063]